MPAPEARQGHRDSRGIWALLDRPGLRDCGVCRDRLDLKAPKAIRALRGLPACREREDQLGLPRWISGLASSEAQRCARPLRY